MDQANPKPQSETPNWLILINIMSTSQFSFLRGIFNLFIFLQWSLWLWLKFNNIAEIFLMCTVFLASQWKTIGHLTCETKFWIGRLWPEVQTLNLLKYTIFHRKGTLSYIFYWQPVPPSHTSLKCCIPFNRCKWTVF